jgi:hypothetical protein
MTDQFDAWVIPNFHSRITPNSILGFIRSWRTQAGLDSQAVTLKGAPGDNQRENRDAHVLPRTAPAQ